MAHSRSSIFMYIVLSYNFYLYIILKYYILSHALKNTANQRLGLPLHILRYTTGNMQRLVFHSTLPSLLARNSLLGSIWGLFKSQLRNSSTPANHYEHLRDRVRRFFEDFRALPKIFRKFLKNHKKKPSENYFWTASEVFRKLPKISEHFRRYPRIFRKF